MSTGVCAITLRKGKKLMCVESEKAGFIEADVSMIVTGAEGWGDGDKWCTNFQL